MSPVGLGSWHVQLPQKNLMVTEPCHLWDLKLLLSHPTSQNPAPYSSPMYNMEMERGRDMMQHVAQEQKFGSASGNVPATSEEGRVTWGELRFILSCTAAQKSLAYQSIIHNMEVSLGTFHSKLHKNKALC